ncbi:MAG: thrombospondin type 3 repeat-containing protein [Deltaproteobacteria bacterium]|nr:thrombospondin type 3 repeat-containing protein [Deltaproteobacteria bacterium]
MGSDASTLSMAWTGSEAGVLRTATRDYPGFWPVKELYLTDVSIDPTPPPSVTGSVTDQLTGFGSHGDSTNGRLAWAGDRYGVVWQAYRDNNWDIFFSLLSGGNELNLSLGDTTDDFYPSTAWNGSGFGVAWTRAGSIYFTSLECPPDSDGDGVEDAIDNCPTDPNPLQEDGDSDTVGDVCDNCPGLDNLDQADADGDSVGDLCDNCPADGNPIQTDDDGDTYGAACDCDDTNPALWECNTPVGPGPVTVTDPTDTVTVIIPDVTQGGDTTVTVIDCNDLTGGTGIAITGGSTCATVETTATFSGFAEVCMTYEDDGTCSGAPLQPCTSDASCQPSSGTCVDPNEANLAMVRFPPPPDPPEVLDTAPPPPGSQDTVNNIMCGATTSFSEFVIAMLLDTDGDFTADLLDNCPDDYNFFQTDQEPDGLGDICDNCQYAPNAIVAGTCTKGDLLEQGLWCGANVDCGAGGFCSMGQEDDYMVPDGVGDACDPRVVPFYEADVLATPECFFSGGCTPADFPADWGVIRTFRYGMPPGEPVTDVRIQGTWGGDVFNGSAPAEIYLEGVFIAECLASNPCWDEVSTVDWNGGAGFLLSDLGLDFSDPSVRSRFEDGDAELSVIQNDETSVHMSNLKLTVYLPEPGGLLGLGAGGLLLACLNRLRDRRRMRSSA